MHKTPKDINQMLPYGEMLRSFLEQPFVQKNDLKKLLRDRGVFVNADEKKNFIPILTSTILSPTEFQYLIECQNFREDNPKVNTQTIACTASEDLIDLIPENLDATAVIDQEFLNFRVIGAPTFSPIENDPNRIKMNFRVEREDMSKSWASSRNEFEGSLEISKVVKDDNNIKLVITHTANETKQVASKLAKKIVDCLKVSGHIDQSEDIQQILFSRFSNTERINYLLSLSVNCTSTILEFVDIVDLDFSPDTSKNLPNDINWMQEKIDKIKMNGQSLHETFFVVDQKFHEYLLLRRVNTKYKFEVKGTSGTCILSLEFPQTLRSADDDSELQVNVQLCHSDFFSKQTTINNIKILLIRELENQKIARFNEIIASG